MRTPVKVLAAIMFLVAAGTMARSTAGWLEATPAGKGWLAQRALSEVANPGCAQDPLPTPTPRLSPNDSVTLERTSCEGYCPQYTVEIRADGQVSWRGERFVRITGAGTGTVAPELARALINKALEQGFWSLCGNYSSGIVDASMAITTLRVAGRVRRAPYYHTSSWQSSNPEPAWLRDFETEIEALADTHRWIHGDPQLETFNRIPIWPPSNEGVPFSSFGSDAGRPKPGVTALMKASVKGDVAEIQRQLDAKADPNAKDSSGWTALMYATQAPDTEAIKMLLGAGADPKARSSMDQTALMANFTPPRLAKVRLLVEAGADINGQDKNGQTALMFPLYGAMSSEPTGQSEHIEIVSFLRRAGARTDLRDAAGLTALDHLRAAAGRKDYPAPAKSPFEQVRQALQ